MCLAIYTETVAGIQQSLDDCVRGALCRELGSNKQRPLRVEQLESHSDESNSTYAARRTHSQVQVRRMVRHSERRDYIGRNAA